MPILQRELAHISPLKIQVKIQVIYSSTVATRNIYFLKAK